MGEKLRFSLICTVYNEEKNINKFLKSYFHQTKKADEFIVVDGGSKDLTASIIERFSRDNPQLNVRLIVDPMCNRFNSNAPISKGRNVAIKNSNYDVIVTTDAGCILDTKWFEKITAPYEENSDVQATGGVYSAISETDFGDWYISNFMPNDNDFYKEAFLPSSRNFSFKKKIWLKVGGYPLGTFAGEDTKYVLEIKKLGVSIIMTDALVQWVSPQTIDEAESKHYQYALGDGYHGQLYKKYFFSIFKIPIIFILSLFFKDFNVKKRLSKSIASGFLLGLSKRVMQCLK